MGPIFQREFLTVPRRAGHYAARAAYLGALWVIGVTAWLSTQGWERGANVGESARFGQVLFQVVTFVQLALFLFFSALAAASAVAKEKDRRTFILLLMTDLRDYEIVGGKALGSLLPMVLLLLASAPLLASLTLLGGVSGEQVAQVLLVVGATMLAASSLGGLVALWRDRTFQSLALTALVLVFYLMMVRGLAVLPLDPESVVRAQEALDPFLALASVHNPVAPEYVPAGEGGGRAVGVAPAYLYAAVMLGWAALLNAVGVARLRVWNPSGEPIMQRERPEDEAEGAEGREVAALAAGGRSARASVHAAPGAVREVGGNPILWREIYTRAYGRRPLLVKTAYAVVIGLICYFALAPLLLLGERPPFAAAYGLLPAGVLTLLLVTAQAATAITTERDTGALDLLLVTDLSPQEFIFGKLLGVLYNTKEYLLPPLILAGVYAWLGCLATPARGHEELRQAMNGVALVAVVGAATVVLGFCMVLGVHVALRTPNSQAAIINALSTVFFLTVGTLVTIALILINRQFEYQWFAFLFFLLAGVGGMLWVLSGDRPTGALLVASIFCPLAVLYAVINVLVARPGSQESADPMIPFLVVSSAFGFAIAAMLVPLLSEFDLAMGRSSGGAD